MKKGGLYLLIIAISFSAVLACQKQVDFSEDIALLKNEVAALKNSITLITAQLTTLESSLKAKIELTNLKIDTINNSLSTLNNKTLLDLSNSIKAIGNSITDITENNKKSLDSLKKRIDEINGTLGQVSSTSATLTSAYNQLLSNYIGVLKIAQTTVSIVQIKGSVFKGSFLRGSLLFLYELDSNLNQTGRSFNTTIDDDYGNFELKAQNLKDRLVRVVGDGFYWNEVLNDNSLTRISLTGICKVDSSKSINVNVLTHLERSRVEYLYGTIGLSFDSAKTQAITEVLKAFGYENTGIKRAENVNVVGLGDESKILLAISTLIQGYRAESEVTQILNDIANDIKKDGKLDDINIGNDLETHLYYVDTSIVLDNFKSRYKKLYNTDTVNAMNMSFIKKFQDATNYSKNKDLFEFPEFEKTGKYKNILHSSTSIITTSSFGVTANVTRKGMRIKVEVLNEDGSSVGCTFSFPQGIESGWTIAAPNCIMPTFTSNGQTLQNTYANFGSKKNYRINIYEKGLTTPTRFKIIAYQ